MHLNRIHTNTIIKELHTEGHSPLLVMGNDYQMYVAKNDKGLQPPFSLINEFFASFCFRYWNISAPDVTIIDIASELILNQEDLSQNHRAHYYNTPCFGSKFINDSNEINPFLITDKKKAYNKLNNPLDVFHITLFDTWVENDDRKPTNYNLILAPNDRKFNIVPIDNAFIFSTMSYEFLNPEYVSVSVNDHLLVSDLGYLVKKNIAVTNDFVSSEREYFYLCIERCKVNFDDFIKSIRSFYVIDDNSILSLKAFLFNDERNNKVFNEYVYRLNQ